MTTTTDPRPAAGRRRGASRRTLPTVLLSGSLAAAAGLAVLVPLNMGGCGTDAGSALSSIRGAAGGDLNGIHTGNEAVDRAGVGTLANAGKNTVELLKLNDREEANLGRNVAVQLTNHYGALDDDTLNRYVTQVGLAVADASPRSDYDWCFCVLNSDEVNAFSGPGGFVLVTRGALARMRDESELAGVLGHEIGHVVRGHGMAAVKRAKLSAIGNAAVRTQAFYGQFGQASDAATDLVMNVGYSQAEESDADTDAVRYAAAAGYAPDGFLHFLQRLESDPAVSSGGKLFPTHPGIGDRVRHVSDQIARAGAAGKGQTNADRFAANVRVR